MRFPALLLSILLASAYCTAAEYPNPKGYLNDFADQLSPGDQQALESRLRAFEQKTSIEVAVAIVPSLQQESVETFATGLFRFWGIGKQGRNNGVLFLWAPAERKVRIEVGYGLESALPNAATAEILRETTALFRQQRYIRGVEVAVDGIMRRLDGSSAGSLPARPPDEAAPPSRAPLWTALVFVTGIAIATLVILRNRRAWMVRFRAELPQKLQELDALLEKAETGRQQAEADLGALKGMSPPEVWTGLADSLTASTASLARLREEAVAIRRQPHQEYSELRAVSRSLERWQHRLSQNCWSFTNVSETLKAYCFRRDWAEKQMGSLGASLQEFALRYSTGGLPGRAETLLPAAQETYARATLASTRNPANWFLVFDLLSDVQECLDRIENSYQWSRRPRCWSDSDVDSPAIAAMAILFSNTIQVRDNSGSDASLMTSDFGGGGGSSGGDSSGGGGFGGGDSGGAGSSDSY